MRKLMLFQTLQRLKSARANFHTEALKALASDGIRHPSFFERDLENMPSADAISYPCPHVFDSTPMRPVSSAVQEGMNAFSRIW